ncbi:SDR family NAD(P)-dependent oxidoreductase [Streptomyces sp. MMG1533]|uniref:SDR family NAD(P)-dependent oxidoreductase n=1 Tax=Streptomyces sp. MMG1533 TaxID=1415546 RepID=UPI0007C764DF|nr:SDR family NAD(P)-dependent oxidoreductase [Streptomyces sp. MMG1533]
MSTGLHERSVVVTGAGSDVGRAAAVRFAREGAHVLVADPRRAGAEETVKAVADVGGTALAVIGDLSDQQVVDQVVDTAVDAFGGVDVLVHHSGLMGWMSALGETDDAEWYRVVEVNLTAPFLLTRAVLPHMLAAERGSIVFTVSGTGLRGAAGAACAASKHGVIGLVGSLATAYLGAGIRANAVASGDTTTAESQAATIVFLASAAADGINGAVLPVDDGWSGVGDFLPTCIQQPLKASSSWPR